MESRNGTDDLIYKAEMETQMYRHQEGRGDGMNWEIGVGMYTLLCIN